MICASSPLRAHIAPIPHLASLKGRALVGRDFIFQMRFAHGSATKKEGGEIALLISNHSEASNFGAGEVLRGSTVPRSRTPENGTTGDFRGVGANAPIKGRAAEWGAKRLRYVSNTP